MKTTRFVRAGVIVFALLLGGGYVKSRMNESKLLPGSKAKVLGTPDYHDSIIGSQTIPANPQTAEVNLLGGSKYGILVDPDTVNQTNHIQTLPANPWSYKTNLLPGSKGGLLIGPPTIDNTNPPSNQQQEAQSVPSPQLLPGSKSFIFTLPQQQSVSTPASKNTSP